MKFMSHVVFPEGLNLPFLVSSGGHRAAGACWAVIEAGCRGGKKAKNITIWEF